MEISKRQSYAEFVKERLAVEKSIRTGNIKYVDRYLNPITTKKPSNLKPSFKKFTQPLYDQPKGRSWNKGFFKQFSGIQKSVPVQRQQRIIQKPLQSLQPRPRQPFEAENRPSRVRNFFEHYDDSEHDDGDGVLLRFFSNSPRRNGGSTGSMFGI